MKNKTSENHRELIRQASKIVSHEWNSHLEIKLFSSNRNFRAIFASPNRYFTESSRWVPLSKCVGLK